MPTVVQLQNAAAAIVVVGVVSGVLFSVWLTVDLCITFLRHRWTSAKERA